MSTDDSPDDGGDGGASDNNFEDSLTDEERKARTVEGKGQDVRDRLEAEADRAIEGFDEGIVDLLSWILETETRARIYVSLRQEPAGTSDEIAEATGLYPSTVREALAELHEEGKVTRKKRQNDGAGNNPYEYSAIPPSDLVGEMVEDVQKQLNTVFNLDDYLTGHEGGDDEPVTITVTDEDEKPMAGGENDGAEDDDTDDSSDDDAAS